MKKRVLSTLLAIAMMLSLVPFAVLAEDYQSITIGEEFLVELEPNTSVWRQFVPETTSTYCIASFDPDVVDPICKVYDSEMNLIAENDDGEGTNFNFAIELAAGETYYFEFCEFESNDAGNYSVKLTYAMPTDIWLDEYSLKTYVGHAFVMTYGSYPYDVPAHLTWTSSDNSVATVDENGLVTCVGKGTTTITVSVGELWDSCVLDVKDNDPIYLNDVKTVTFVPKEQRETAQTFCFVPEESGTYRMYSYDIVSTPPEPKVDPRVWVRGVFRDELAYNDDGGEDVNVDVQCRLEAGKPYFFEIEPYDCEAAGEIKVTLEKCIPAESISIDCGDLVVVEGTDMDIYTTFSPENCAYEDYVCTSSDTSVVRIEGKTAYFVGGGEATITVTSEYGLTDSISVIVEPVTEIFVDTTYTLDCYGDEYFAEGVYKFTPTESGVYRFESFNIVGGWDPRIELQDSAESLRNGDDNGDSTNFMLDNELIADKTYYIIISADSAEISEDGAVDFKVTKLDESNFPTLPLDTAVEITTDCDGANTYLVFTPNLSGVYRFSSSYDESESHDTRCSIFDEDWQRIGGDDDGGSSGNYLFEWYLNAGSTYYTNTQFFSSTERGTHYIYAEYTGDIIIESTPVADLLLVGDETATIEVDILIKNANDTDNPTLFVVDNGEYNTYENLSFDTVSGDTYEVKYTFSKDDFSDGENSRTFAFGVTVDGNLYYTNKFTVNYSSASILLGDVNADGTVDQVDYLLVRRSCFNTYALSEAETMRADVNADGEIDQLDYLCIKRISFGTYKA